MLSITCTDRPGGTPNHWQAVVEDIVDKVLIQQEAQMDMMA